MSTSAQQKKMKSVRAQESLWRLRTLLGAVLCGAWTMWATGALCQTPAVVRKPPPNPARQIPSKAIPASVPDGFTVAAVGDLIIAHPPVLRTNSGFLEVRDLLRQADVSVGNLEESLVNPYQLQVWPAAENGGGDENGPPDLAPHLKNMGFDLLSRANNHSTDWGVRGMLETDKVLDAAGLVHAGTGRTLSSARAPRFLTVPAGRIAFVSMASSFTGMEPAADPRRGVQGRPGINPLHTTQYHIVTPSEMKSLKEMYRSRHHPAKGLGDQMHQDSLTLFGIHYKVGPTPGLTFSMNPHDLDGILRSVRQGKEESHFEVVYVHAHEPGNGSETPADFLPKLAHDAIDAGADEFIASGPHRLRGIEIYKGKPIFYSLGDFFFEIGNLRYLDPGLTQRAGLKESVTTDYEYQQYHLSQSFPAPLWYQSVVAVTRFNSDGKVSTIKLYPIDMGYKRTPRASRGVPYLASHEVAQQILKRLQRLSRPYGTVITIEGDVGVIRASGK